VKFTEANARMNNSGPGNDRSHRRRWCLAAAALAVVPLAAAGCTAGGAGPGNSGATVQITVAAAPGVDTAPLFIAKNDGAFARAGLDVTIQQFPTVKQELAALSNGSVDIAEGDYVDFFYQVNRAARGYGNLRVIADGYHAAPGVMEILSLPEAGIMTPGDLAGKTIGTPLSQGIPSSSAPYSLETLVALSALGSDGVDTSHIAWKPMPTRQLITALNSGTVAAIVVQEPYIIEAEGQIGAVPVLDASSGPDANLPLYGYFASASFVRMHAPAIKSFRSVLQEAQAAAVVPGPVRAQLAHSGLGMQTASLVTIGSYPTTLDAASLQRVADLMFKADMFLNGAALTVSGYIAG
jgi:NitT/TauT family transport system substrate-binding protein